MDGSGPTLVRRMNEIRRSDKLTKLETLLLGQFSFLGRWMRQGVLASVVACRWGLLPAMRRTSLHQALRMCRAGGGGESGKMNRITRIPR